MTYYRFDRATGAYLGSMDGPPVVTRAFGAGEVVLEDVDPETTCFDPETGAPAARPSLVEDAERAIAADGTDELVLDVPSGTFVFVSTPAGRRQGDRVDDGTFVLTTTLPGVYTIEIIPPPTLPHRRQSLTVTAHAP